jgi:hypothetical protein
MVKSDNIISPEKEEIIESILEVLGEPYQYARDMHIHNEIATFKRDWVGMYNLRDAFDHLRKLLIYLFEDDDNNKANRELAEMEAHLYRAILEGAQNVTEVYLGRIDKKLKPRILYRLSFVDVPSETEITTAISSVKEKIEHGRNYKPKNWKEAAKSFKEAEDILKSLEQKLPSPNEIRYRLIVVGLTTLTLLIGIGIGRIF